MVLKNISVRIQPCNAPVIVTNQSIRFASTLTALILPSYRDCTG